MRIKRITSDGKWCVACFVDDHNHGLDRNMSDVDIAHINNLREVGISIPKVYQSFAMQVGGFNLVRFTKQDMLNEVRKQHALQEGDVNATVWFFECVARDDERLFWRYEVGDVSGMHEWQSPEISYP
ncbi:hypothetical protein Ahy_A01g003197 [Arachis hypogaea]|uniref:Protein FAR1-RELATED SEQUENCE n=1 Tax=Arachis hypogaea TaxID=3818 RepID=A0A445ESS4_ARAHY|nr:hypothetical protein Ahy_A01g003197 [Arachis hypogaea]